MDKTSRNVEDCFVERKVTLCHTPSPVLSSELMSGTFVITVYKMFLAFYISVV